MPKEQRKNGILVLSFLCIIGSFTLGFVAKPILSVEQPIETEQVIEVIEEKGPTEIDKIQNAISKLKPQIDIGILSIVLVSAEKYAKEYNIPLTLVLSIINRESGFNPLAVSSKGARGLMQIMTKVHEDKLKELDINSYQAMHIDNNINLGCWILKEYYDKTGDMQNALSRYVGGVHESYFIDILKWYLTLNTMLMDVPKDKEENKEETVKQEENDEITVNG